MNRILVGIDRAKASIAEKGHSPEKLAEYGKKLDMPLDEYVAFQNLKSTAVLSGKLTLEESMTVYGFLGNTPEHFNQQPVEVKWVLTEVFAKLLAR